MTDTPADARRWAVALHEAALQAVRVALAADPAIAHLVDDPDQARWTVSIDITGRRLDVVVIEGDQAVCVGSIGLDPQQPDRLGRWQTAAVVMPTAPSSGPH
jgi:hypothetical protein